MGHARALGRNIGVGFRLATFRGVAPGAFYCDASQVALLALVTLSLAAASAVTRDAAPFVPLLDSGADVLTILLCGALFGALRARPALRCELPVVLLSLAPVGTLAAGVIQLGWAAARAAGSSPTPWLVASVFYFAWVFLTHYRGIELTTGGDARRVVPAYALYLAVGLVTASILPRPAPAGAPTARVAGEPCAAPCPGAS